MGSWFANIGVRKKQGVGPEEILRRVSERVTGQGYEPAASPEEADVSFAVVTRPDSRWFTLYSDGMDPGEALCAGLAAALSATLNTETLEIACFDSDYLYLNLIDASAKLDAWAGVGSAAGMGIKRRTGFAAWKNRVEDFPRFQEGIRQKRICAEDALYDIAPCLGLPAEQSNACYEDIKDGDGARLHFRLPDQGESDEPVRLTLLSSGGGMTAWSTETYEDILALNEGGASRGLEVFFISPGLTSGEVVLRDVRLTLPRKRERVSIPIELEKVKLKDGGWAYYYHDPNIKIPGRVPDGLPIRKQIEERYKRAIGVQFLPQGELEQVADITVHLVPDGPHEGHMAWWPWWYCDSKEEFIAKRREYERDMAEWLRHNEALQKAAQDEEKPD